MTIMIFILDFARVVVRKVFGMHPWFTNQAKQLVVQLSDRNGYMAVPIDTQRRRSRRSAVSAYRSPKLSPPRLFGVSLRHRLFERLDALRAHPGIWVAGFPGVGKTTLLVSYCESRHLPCLWYQVDGHDADAAQFFHYLSLAAAQLMPRKKLALPAIETEALHDLAGFARRFFRELFAQLPPQALLVFDNFHEAGDQSSFHTAICEAISQVPENINIVLISRGKLPSVLTRLQLTQALGWLRGRELRLTLEESRAIAGESLPDATISAIHHSCEGWVSGLVLAMAHVKAGDPLPTGLGGEAKDAVFDFLSAQLFSKASAQMQQMLLCTAFLPRFTGQMASSISGNHEAGRLLEYLVHNHLFTYRNDASETVYQYHSLLQAFLAARALLQYGATRCGDLAAQAGKLLNADGHFEDAFDSYVAAGIWQQAAKIVAAHASELIAEGRGRTVRAWIERFPPSIKADLPLLNYWNGVASLEFDPVQSRADLEVAFAAFDASGDDRGALLAWSWITKAIVLEWRDHSLLDRWIAWLDKRLAVNPGFPDADTETRVTASMAVALYSRQLHRDDVANWMERAFHAAMQSQDGRFAVLTVFQIAHYHFYLGDPARVSLSAQWCSQKASDPNAGPLVCIVARLLEAYGWLVEGNVAAALAATASGLEMAQSSAIHMFDRFLNIIAIHGCIGSGDPAGAGRLLLSPAVAINGQETTGFADFQFLSAAHALQVNDATRALGHAKMAVEFGELAGSPYFNALYRSGYLQILHERGFETEALELIDTILPLAARYGSVPIQVVCLLLGAQLAFDRGDAVKGLNTLREAFGLLSTRGANFVLWWWRPGLLADLCVRALNAQIEVRYVRDLVKALHLVPSELPVECRHWPWPIKVKMLGPFEIVIGDEPMRFSGKAQQKPLDLLRILVAFGGEGVAAASIAEKLWPQADGDSAHCAFDVTLHRLRKLLGSDSAILLSDGRLSLNPREVWVDVFAFDRLIEQIRRSVREGNASAGPAVDRLAEQALLLFRGHFLEHEGDQPWMLPMRERLCQRFQNLIFRLGHSLEQGGHWARAERLYRRGLEADALAEGFYLRLMVCHREQGRLAEAMEVYRRCRNMLSVVLGASPSVETKSLFASLQHA